MAKKDKTKIGKVIVFNVYGNDETNNLFSRVDNCEDLISQHINSLDARITEKVENLISDMPRYYGKNREPDMVINSNRDIARLESRINQLESRINQLERENAALRQEAAQNNEYIKQITKALEKQNNKIEEQNRIISEIVNLIRNEAPPKKAEPEPEKFNMPVLNKNKDEFFVTDNTTPDGLKDYLTKAADISEMKEALKQTETDAETRRTYDKILDLYQKRLISDINRKNISELDDYEISEEVITMVGNAVQNTITEKIIPAVCDRIKRGFTEFSVFLEAINRYLESVGFYTKNINTGDNIQDNDNSIQMNVTYTATSDKNLHGLIYEISTPPYVINYIDTDDNDAEFVCKGSCAVYRYEE